MYETGAAASAWATLRATRWEPPGAARLAGGRARTYVVALEQAEQMFRAAANVGQATRPVLAYYGLNQAGRAISAAALTAGAEEWRLSGRGIYAKNLQWALAEIAVTCDAPGGKVSFGRLSQILDSPLWAGSTMLQFFWDSIPETRLSPLAGLSQAQDRGRQAQARRAEAHAVPAAGSSIAAERNFTFAAAAQQRQSRLLKHHALARQSSGSQLTT